MITDDYYVLAGCTAYLCLIFYIGYSWKENYYFLLEAEKKQRKKTKRRI